MPGYQPFLTAPGNNRVFVIFSRSEVFVYQSVEDRAYLAPRPFRDKDIKPVLADDLLFSARIQPFLLIRITFPARSRTRIMTPATSRYRPARSFSFARLFAARRRVMSRKTLMIFRH
jgi:hypothetical protein